MDKRLQNKLWELLLDKTLTQLAEMLGVGETKMKELLYTEKYSLIDRARVMGFVDSLPKPERKKRERKATTASVVDSEIQLPEGITV